MLEKVKDVIANSKPLQGVLVLLLGVFLGAVFYPTKHIEETLTKKHQEEIAVIKEQHQKELTKEHESYVKVSDEFRSYHAESEKKISTLTTKVTNLESHQKTAYYKVVRPDGTIEIKRFSETDVSESTKVVTQIQEEFKQKVDSIENKWETIHKERVTQIQKQFDAKEQEYKKTIDEMKQTKVVDINKKSFGIEVGLLTNKDYYGHVTYDLFGPLFIGGHAQFGPEQAAGLGIGLRL
jgi:hypothetical protein